MAIVVIERQLVGRAGALDQFGQQEQGAQRQGGADQVEQGTCGQCHLAEADGRHEGACRHQYAQAGHALQALGGKDRHCGAGQGRQATIDQPLATEEGRSPCLAGKQQGPQAQHRIGAHLGHDREQCCHWSAGGGVGWHQPEVQRPDAGLGQEGDGQDRRTRMQQATIGLGYQRDFHGQVGHVQRTGDAIEHGRADQEQR
ncbi:hypothetical protein D3C77_429790 [compost metagenome]